jgi:prepilin-type N-terminal cleavage/methylation domain
MKKNGFTLIETMLCIFILTLLFSIGATLNKFAVNLCNHMKSNVCVYEIQNLLAYGKAVCRDKNKYGKLTIDPNKNEIRFVEGFDKIEKIINVPKEISIDGKYTKIFITPNGKISTGTSIKLIDNYRERQIITVGVGVDFIDIKGEEFL